MLWEGSEYNELRLLKTSIHKKYMGTTAELSLCNFAVSFSASLKYINGNDFFVFS